MSASRYQRQVSVPGVGARGQAAIREAAIAVGGDSLAAEICALYLAGAGVGTLIVAPALAAGCRAINSQVEVIVREGGSAYSVRVERRGEEGARTFPESPESITDPVLAGAAGARWALARILSSRPGQEQGS